MKSPAVIFHVTLTPRSKTPMYEQLYLAVRRRILDGRLYAGARLPSTRAWSEMLGISRFTVVEAMERLIAEGYLVPRRGAGTTVAETVPDRAMRPPRRNAGNPPTLDQPPTLSVRGRVLSATVITGPRRENAGPRAFHPRRAPLDVFPIHTWARSVRRHWAGNRFRALDYGHPAGYLPLRQAIATHLLSTRGVRCSVDHVVITSGSQQAFDLLFRLLLDPGQQAWIEEPGYLDVRAALVAAGAQIVPVSVDSEGLDVEEGIRRAPEARVAVVSPSHQYPTGATLSATRRAQLLGWARRQRSWIVEDDYDSYFRYRGRPMSALQGQDSGRPTSGEASPRVVYVGTFSKTMFPSLRLGYCVVPDALIDAVTNARAVADRHSPTIDQAVLADFIGDGHYDRHLRRVRLVCQERYQAMQFYFERAFAGAATLMPAAAGTHVLARLTDGRTARGSETPESVVAREAADEDLVVFPLSRYCLRPPEREALVLGYGALPPAAIADGIERLARVVSRVATR